MRIVFFGTSRFAAQLLAHLISQPSLNILAVVTRPDRAQGRSLRFSASPVKQEVQAHHPSLLLYQPEKASTNEFAASLLELQPDLFVVAAYGEIIKQNLLSLPKLGCINVHASLLPKYRGAAPIQRCLMDGEKETGITIIEMVRALDAGPMLERISVPIEQNTTFGELEQKLLLAACEAIDKSIQAFVENRVIKISQDETKVTYAAKLSPSEEEINWDLPAETLHNLIRALSPAPSAWCKIFIRDQDKRLKIKRSNLRRDLEGEPGKVIHHTKESLIIACGKDALELLEVQLEGKKALQITDFLRGLGNSSFSFSKSGPI